MAKTLLLADDSVTIQRVVELTFAHEDIHVVSMSDGQRAISWLDAERPDIVLVDVAVPEVDGYEVAAHVKKSSRLKHVPVLLLAGAFEPVDEARSRSIGCDGVIVKPFEPKQLVERVKELLADARPARGGGRDRQKAEPAAAAAPGPRSGPATDPIFAGNMGTVPSPAGDEPQPLELPKPLWGDPSGGTARAAAEAPPHAPPKVSLVNAFSALLAAEKSVAPAPQAAAPAAAPVSDAAIEEAVRRVLSRMTGDMVRRIVHDTAERLIREEIEKIKAANTE
ncbi:MAG: response regulator [Vicinamibacterales bacterium]